MVDGVYVGFEWDEHKAKTNAGKHAVTFEEATESFYDPCARVINDPDHSDSEERFILIGMSMSARVLTVSHCVRGEGLVIRIISARKATKSEERQYWRYRK
ncbi:BrnT family toxin [Arcanobacterium canis]